MKILLTVLHFANCRNFESAIRELAARGHQVHILADEPETFGGEALVQRMAAEYPSITWGYAASLAEEPLSPVAQKLRYALDYVRYLAPRYADVPKLRIRNVERAPRIVRWLTSGAGGAIVGHRVVARALMAAERSLPVSAATRQQLEAIAPDAVLLTSLTVSRSRAMEQLKAARALGIPTAGCIMSWDHLSSKALLHIPPDRTIVWNDVQKREAIEMHGIAESSIAVTGAQCYDQWFDRTPSRTREAFCRAVGLDPSKPFILYVCSTMSPVPNPVEPVFAKEWIAAVRASGDPMLRAAGILVRPHPERVREWNGVSLDGFENVVVHGRTPIDSDAKADYFDSLYYSSAVVGLCTSAFLEAGIVGRPVLTLLLPTYRMHQDGMAHFRYLQHVEGGLLHTAASIDAHLLQLADALARGGEREERNRRFITAFVRPQGLDIPSTPRFADVVEQLTKTRPSRLPQVERPSFAHAAVMRLAAAGTHGAGAWLLMDSVDDRRAFGEHEREVAREAMLAERAARWEAERRERAERVRVKGEQRRAKAERAAERLRLDQELRAARQRNDSERKIQLDAMKRRKQRWRRWRYALGTSGPVTRLKGSLKLLIGTRHQ